MVVSSYLNCFMLYAHVLLMFIAQITLKLRNDEPKLNTSFKSTIHNGTKIA